MRKVGMPACCWVLSLGFRNRGLGCVDNLDRQTDRQTDRETERQRDRDRETERQRDRETESRPKPRDARLLQRISTNIYRRARGNERAGAEERGGGARKVQGLVRGLVRV